MLSHTQNYINNKKLVLKLINFVNFGQASFVFEIGPGKGIITEQLLLQTSSKVTVIEADSELCIFLKDKFRAVAQNKLEIVFGNVLKYNFPRKPFIVVSNIPFNITADIVRKLTEEKSMLQEAYLIVQKEAATKLIGPPHAHSPLFSHILNLRYEIKLLLNISKKNYSPKPKYNTALISIKKRERQTLNDNQTKQFKDFLVYLFERKRESIRKALKLVTSNIQAKIILKKFGIDESRDIKNIYFFEWINIFTDFSEHSNKKALQKISGSYKMLQSEQKTLKKIHRTRKD